MGHHFHNLCCIGDNLDHNVFCTFQDQKTNRSKDCGNQLEHLIPLNIWNQGSTNRGASPEISFLAEPTLMRESRGWNITEKNLPGRYPRVISAIDCASRKTINGAKSSENGETSEIKTPSSSAPPGF